MFGFFVDLFKPTPAKAPPITSETSMNFDLADIAPFFTRLANVPAFKLPEDIATVMAAEIGALAVDETKRWKISGDFRGAPIDIEVEAFMDDIDAPDLAFFSTQAAIAEIDAELLAFAELMER